MKTFLKVAAAILAFIIVIAVGLNLYFTDDRLKSTLMPYINEAVGRTVEVESMSLTFFSTFPQPGISVRKLRVPGETESDTLLALDELLASVELFSLLGDQISISEISLRNPRFTYAVRADSSTNIDFLMETEEAETDSAQGYAVNIPSFRISNAQFGYSDAISGSEFRLNDLNADISLRYADLIQSTVEMKIGGLTASVEGTDYVRSLPVDLKQSSTIDLSNETLQLDSGTLSIRGLGLDLSGTIANWSDNLDANLNFRSSSDNFGDLLRLLPEHNSGYVEGLETSGRLAIEGTLSGALAAEQLPEFDISVQVENGYLKNPDLPRPIEQIAIDASATNKLLTIDQFTARAGENTFSGSGRLVDPLREDASYSIVLDGKLDLATVSQFYDISQFGVEQMSGGLTVDGRAAGRLDQPEQANFQGLAKLENGSLKYIEVDRPIQNITIDAEASQSALTFNTVSMKAADNTFSLRGTVTNPLKEEQRAVDLSTELRFDLSTIKEFYPIDEDTLQMRGLLTANATLKGKASQIERSVQKGSISLSDGYLNHHKLGKPMETITFESTLEGPFLTLSAAQIRSGDNNLEASGQITDYLSDNRSVDLQINGKADLGQLNDFYELKPTINSLSGQADLNLNVSGPPAKPSALRFQGSLTARGINMEGEGLVQPVKNLNGDLELSPASVNLDQLAFQIGSSDIAINGSLNDYMTYLKAEEDRETTPQLSGTYKSEFLNLDELIDWEDTTATEPIPIHLPDLNSSVTAEVSKMMVTGVSMTSLTAQASTTPEQIRLEKASVQLFEGEASGAFRWDVPRPDRTKISFQGTLDSLKADSFFREYPILGEKSKFHEYVSGSFSANVDYESELNVYLEPLMETSKMQGDFGMTKSRLKGHPLQDKVASLLDTKEFRNLVLDQWKSTYSLDNSIFTIKDLRLTSGDIGMELNGTQHLTKGTIDYQMRLLLPGRFKSAIASVVTKQAADALTRENGTIMVPLQVTGTHENPQLRPDKKVIEPIVKKYLKDKAGNVLKKLFDGNNK